MFNDCFLFMYFSFCFLFCLFAFGPVEFLNVITGILFGVCVLWVVPLVHQYLVDRLAPSEVGDYFLLSPLIVVHILHHPLAPSLVAIASPSATEKKFKVCADGFTRLFEPS